MNIKDMGTVSVTTDMSKSKILIVFTAIGVVLAIVIVYLINIFDNSVRTRDDLERISECAVLSTIENIGGDN